MRKLALLAILAVPVSAVGAYALATGGDPVAPDSPIIINEADKTDLTTSDQGLRLFAMEDSDEEETEAGPITSDSLKFLDDDHEGDHDGHGDHDD